MVADEASFENALIEDMRAHDGAVTGGPLKGHPLLIMTSKGARTGESRRAILTWSRDGEAYVVAGTAGGSRTDPSWGRNLMDDPNVTIEMGNRTFPARAALVDSAEREGIWNRHVAALPWFAAYPEQTGREIPMFRLTPVGG
jgi:deazaflavin-dependent oxidoreductase (nitroreductase family)